MFPIFFITIIYICMYYECRKHIFYQAIIIIVFNYNWTSYLNVNMNWYL